MIPKPPKDVRLRRYGLFRVIPAVDLVDGQQLLTVGGKKFVFLGEVEETQKIILDDSDQEIKQGYNYFSRDADFDGQVQDGTRHQRRSRSLTHLIFSRRLDRPRQAGRSRLRDLPVEVFFPTGPSRPTPKLSKNASEFELDSKANNKPKLSSFSSGSDIGGGKKISIDSPGIRNAVTRGAVVDDAGHLRCPPATPGAMQFTNWKLEGCGSPRKITRKKIQLAAEELAEFTAAGGQIVSSADIANYRAAASGSSVGMTPNIRRRQRVAERIRGTTTSKRGKEASFTGLSELVASSKKSEVRLDLSTGGVPETGLALPRPESSRSIELREITDWRGQLTEDGAAQIVEWLDGVMNDPGRTGAVSAMATISQVHPPRQPRSPEAKPLTGKAQDLADRAGGDFNKFMELLDSEDLVIFDFETTGMGADGNMPVEVAAIRVRGGKVVERKHIYMAPGRPLGGWSRENLKDVNGNPLTDEWLSDQTPLPDAMRELTDFMGDSIIVAHNAPFDTEILSRVSAEHGVDFTPAGVIDTLSLSRQMIPKSETPEGRHTLEALATHFGVKMDSWHTAWSDTDSLVGILAGFRKRGKEKPVDPSVLDRAVQEERYARELEQFNTEMASYRQALDVYKQKWGTEDPVARLDVHDIFDEKEGGSKKEKEQAFQAVLDIADQENTPHVVRLSDGTVTNVGDAIATPVQAIESPTNPARARIHDAKTRLRAAFSALEGKDNMNLDAFTPEEIRSFLTIWQGVPGFTWIDPENPDHLWLALDQGAENILKLAESADPEDRKIWRRWYEAAGKFSADLGERHGFSHDSSAAVVAVLSPTQDWNGNIALADHVMKLYADDEFTVSEKLAEIVGASFLASHEKDRSPAQKIDGKWSGGSLSKKIAGREEKLQDLRNLLVELSTSGATSDQMKKVRDQIAGAEKELAELKIQFDAPPLTAQELVGKKFKDLDIEAQARVAKFHAQIFGGSYMGQPPIEGKGESLRMYTMTVDEAGDYVLGVQDDKVRVQSFTQYKKALTILAADKKKKSNLALIDKELGKGSKVRSFYNNIRFPNDPRYADVTADTHHFGAATLIPVSAGATVLDSIFSSSGASGVSGAYPLVRAMTVLATSRWNAEHDDDLMPRAMQSIAWETIRRLVPTKFENPSKPGELSTDTTLKSHMTNTAAQIARLTSGPSPKRKDLVGRELELLDELSSALQKTPDGEGRREQVLQEFRDKYNLPKLLKEDILPKEVKVKKDGTIVEVDRETKQEIIVGKKGAAAVSPGKSQKSPKSPPLTDRNVTYMRSRQEEAIAETAAKLHDAWRAPRRKEDGTFEPRMKDNGLGGEVDIANTNYADLPAKWQEENRLSAQHAVEAILANPKMSDDSIADLVHQDWLRRNGSWAPEEQKKPYSELSQEEKDKDLAVVAAARETILAILQSRQKSSKALDVTLLSKIAYPKR